MNLILLHQEDFTSENQAIIDGRRAKHIRTVHRAQQGDTLTVGVKNGPMGTGLVKEITESTISFETTLDIQPPKPADCTLILALPRPKTLKKALHAALTMGVKKVYFINSYRVEKSYWQTPLLSEEQLTDQIELALEQSKDTIFPEILIRKRFRPFIEDELAEIIQDTKALVGHPVAEEECPHQLNTPMTLIIGPEGGFIPYEIELLKEKGVTPVSMGSHVLRVEVALPALLGKLLP